MAILEVAIPTPLRQTFDYLPIVGSKPLPGMRVHISFGKRDVVGVIVAVKNTSDFPTHKLKTIKALIDTTSILDESLLTLCQWASNYYHHPIGEVMASALPALLRQGKNLSLNEEPDWGNTHPTRALALNPAQSNAVTAITEAMGKFQPFIVDGVTGSGKTEVYLQAIENHLNQKKQALVLIPEIALTPQTITRFTERFDVPIVTLHSGLTDKQRTTAWLQAQLGLAAIVIGTRSAIFTPLLNPGIIIVDEEHDTSYKQQEGFRYSARDLAIVRARIHAIPVVLGTATPCMETYYNISQKKCQRLSLPDRAGTAKKPTFSLIDCRQQKMSGGISTPLLNKIASHLEQNNQVLLFLNRRGFATVLLCHHCGWQALCQRCDARMILHHAANRLICHHCTAAQSVPPHCPNCKQAELIPLGHGTEQIEHILKQHFPLHAIARIDRDTTRKKNQLQDVIAKIHEGQYQILLGTQMLAKGHHFPNVTLVAIIDADTGLYSADFRAIERMGQIIIQVAGRAGRAEKPGEVVLQTHQPQHPLLQTLVHNGYHAFLQKIQEERCLANMPPYSHMALLSADAHDPEKPMAFLQNAKKIALAINSNNTHIFGPIPAPMPKRRGRYRAQLLFNTNDRPHLHQLLTPVIQQLSSNQQRHNVRWHIDIDPIEYI